MQRKRRTARPVEDFSCVTRGELGKQLRDARESLNLTQPQVAKALGTTAQYYGLIESGKRPPNPASVSVLARLLRMPAEELAKSLLKVEHPELYAILLERRQAYAADISGAPSMVLGREEHNLLQAFRALDRRARRITLELVRQFA